MASDTNTGAAVGTNTGNTTANPQSSGQSNSQVGVPQNPQSLVSTSSINNQTTGTGIQLPPATGRTAAISVSHPRPLSTHKVSTTALIPIAILILAAIAIGIYIFVTSKSSNKYS